MRFHVLGVSFAPTNREYSCEGFSQKVRLFCKMMYNRGHVVYHYGIEGSNPICTENINVVSRETYEKIHKRHDYKKDGFIYFSENEAQDEFNFNTIIEIYKRKQVNDFLCFSFGFPQRPIYDAHSDLIATEIGIGFDGSFTPNRIFESYAWMHCIYGKEGNLNSPNLYDAVIPNYYDLDDYIYSEEKDNYFFFIARMNSQKGLDIAIKCAEYVGCKLLIAGTGTPQFESDNLIHLGVVDFEQRAKLMSRAKATFVTSKYVEPYGSTVVESLLCGTPVISTDIGAFTENVIHGKVGYRCKTMEHFYWATKNIHNIKPIDCRNYAVNNFEINRIGLMYEEYFKSLQNSKEHDSWWQNDINRKNLDYLNKYIPEKNEIKNKKQILCILAGYTPELNDNNINKYDSEFSVIKLAESLTKYYDVYIFGNEFTLNRNINGVEYSKFSNFDSFQKNNNIKTIILFRYMFNFLESEILSENIFLWSYDDIILPYYNGLRFINNGKYLLKNIIDNINGVIVRSEEHKTNFKNFYDISDNNIFIIKDIISYNEESISEWYNLLQNKFK